METCSDGGEGCRVQGSEFTGQALEGGAAHEGLAVWASSFRLSGRFVDLSWCAIVLAGISCEMSMILGHLIMNPKNQLI